MEKSNSFKRVLAGTLALLTVASSVPADAGSVIGDFFGSTLVANAEAAIPQATSDKFVTVSDLAITGTTGVAKVTVAGVTKDATVTVTPDNTFSNIKTLAVKLTDGTFSQANVYAVVNGYTVIDNNNNDTEDDIYNATTVTDTLTVRVNEFTEFTANGMTVWTFDGKGHNVKIGKNLNDEQAGDEATVDTGDEVADYNNVEISYLDASGNDVVITEKEYNEQFTKKINGVAAADQINAGTYTIDVVGNANTKFEGVTGQVKFQISALGISDSVNVEANKQAGWTNARIVYNETPASGVTANNDGDPYGTTHNRSFLKKVEVTLPDGTTVDTLEEGVDFDIVYTANEGALTDYYNAAHAVATDGVAESAVNVGKYTATLNFKNNYSGTKSVKFNIVPAELDAAGLKAKLTDATKNGVTHADYDRSNTHPITVTDTTAAKGVANFYGIELTTYKAELNPDGSVKEENGNKVYSSTSTTDVTAAGSYKTVVTASGNFKNKSAGDVNDPTKDIVCEIEWVRDPHSIADDTRVTTNVSLAINPSTGKAEATYNIRDNAETDPTAQAGAKLVQGVDFIAEFKHMVDDDNNDETPAVEVWKTTIPEGNGPFTVKLSGIGNYGNSKKIQIDKIDDYKLTLGDTTLTTKVNGLEKVQYNYGDTIGAEIAGVPNALKQDIIYIPVDLDKNGAPTIPAALSDNVTIANDTTKTDEQRKAAITAIKKIAGAFVFNAETPLAAREKVGDVAYENRGYVAVVIANDPQADSTYNQLFDYGVGYTKGFSVSKRTVDQNSTVAIEFKNPLLAYKASKYSEDDIKANIKSLTIDGTVIDPADYVVMSTKTTADEVKADFTDVDDYNFKIVFDKIEEDTNGDGTPDKVVFAGSNKFTGSYTTDINTQKFSIIATQLTADDFTVNDQPIVAILNEAYDPDGDATGLEASKEWPVNATFEDKNIVEEAVKAGKTIVGYKAATPVLYDGNEKTIDVTAIDHAPHKAFKAADYQVSGATQTAAGEYELTIKGVKNTKGSLTVKWVIKGRDFNFFTATGTPTTFTYNGKPQAPAFTISRAADDKRTNDWERPAVTLTEGTDYNVEYYTRSGDGEENPYVYTKLDTTPSNVGTYFAKIVGAGAYYGATYLDNSTIAGNVDAGNPVYTQFTIAPSADLSIVISPKDKANFAYDGNTIFSRLGDMFDFTVDGKKVDTDEVEMVYHLSKKNAAGEYEDTQTAKDIGEYKIAVTIYNDNYRPKTSDQYDFEITPKEITLTNIKAGTKEAVYGAPVATINRSITFDYDGVIDADKDKVSVDDFRGFVVVSNNYRSGSPAGEYTLTYNGGFVPESDAAKNYKAAKFNDTEKITIAKKDLADAKDNVTLVIVPSDFKNTEPKAVAEGQELKANEIVYNGNPYEVYIQNNDNGLMTMADLDFSGTPKALHAGEYELVATASANGNYMGTTEIPLKWVNNAREITADVHLSVCSSNDRTTFTAKAANNASATDTLNRKLASTIGAGKVFGTEKDVLAGKADFCIRTDVDLKEHLYTDAGVKLPESVRASASEAAGDYTVYFTQLNDKGEPIESTKTTGYPTVAGSYRAEVVFSDDFVLANKPGAVDDEEYVPELAKVGYVDFTIKAEGLDSVIYDMNQLQKDADLTDNNYLVDNKSTAFSRVYGDAIEPTFQIDIHEDAGDALVTAKFDATKLKKYVVDDEGTITIGDDQNTKYKLSDAVYDGTAGYYALEDAIVTNDPNFTVDLLNIYTTDKKALFTMAEDANHNKTLVYTVKQSTDYTIQFTQETNVFELKNGSATAKFQVVDNNSGKVMKEGVDYTLKGTKTYTKAGKYTLFVEGIGNYTGTASADWKIVAAGSDTSVDAKLLDSNTVSFKDQVQFNFLAEINDTAYVDGAYVKFTYDHYGEKVENIVPLNKQDMYGKYYRFRQELTASEMAIPVKAELFLKNSATPISTKERSIKDYAETAIKKDLEGKEVLKAMLNYGGYTQVALKNNKDLLANASADIKVDVSAIQPKSQSKFVRPTPYEGTTTVATAGIPQSVKIKFTPTVTYKGTTVMTKSMLYVRHYFTVDPSITEDELNAIKVRAEKFDIKTMKYTGNPSTINLVKLPKNSTGYYLDVPAEMAYNLDKDRGSITVYDFPGTVTNAESYTDGANTVAAGAATYKVGADELDATVEYDYADGNDYDDIYAINVTNYNVVDYCEAIANNSKQSTANKNMVKALYAYYQAANAYVAGRS
ncbi:hypothetical protein [Ruminococcus sp. NK3A76]|uniref:hypothetical protein n=1 Tax=Ruminococcus sp. NK3A76 TaxID=877411 RepID=UPI000490081B|nr:hypothetical protein [Ruminococcus sp. NK3A76]